jgi:hypothetical protein
MNAMTAPDVWSRVPDVAVVQADSMGTTFQERPPVQAVEIASPRTRLYDPVPGDGHSVGAGAGRALTWSGGGGRRTR